jgi:uncharacterized protein (TIGR02147 family)
MQVFEIFDYRTYLDKRLSPPLGKRGDKSALSKHLNTQTGFLSQVFSGLSNLSLEHAISVNEYLGHSEEESHFFILLVEYEKAGSLKLRKYFKKQMDEILQNRKEIEGRLKRNNQQSKKLHFKYYSKWYFSAIHILTSIPKYQTIDSISKKLNLEKGLVSTVLDFLSLNGMVEKENERFKIGSVRVHLPRNSEYIGQHHLNWRLQAINHLNKVSDDDLNYSSVISLSQKDYLIIKEILLKTIEKSEEVLAPSPEEILCSLNIDFFELT